MSLKGVRWEVFWDAGNKQFGIRQIRFWGKIGICKKRGLDYTRYKTKQIYSTALDRKQLEKLRDDIHIILSYGDSK